MNVGMGIDEFANYWRDIMKDIKNCELTEENSRRIWNDFMEAENMLKMSRPVYWYTYEIANRFQQLSSELQAALLVAQSNYRKGYGKSKLEAEKSKFEVIAQSVKEILKKIPSPIR